MVKNIKMGRVSLPMDVSSTDAVPAFENMLTKGPMAVVMVYADWCGHCDGYKKNVWSPLKSVKNRTVNMASLREDMLPKTSLRNAKIDGYPSILVVGKDSKPAVFNSTSGLTNALPVSNDVSTMKSLVTSPIPKEVSSMAKESPSLENATASEFEEVDVDEDTSTGKNAYQTSRATPVDTGVDISYPSTQKANSIKSANTKYTPLNNSTSNFPSNVTPTALNTEPPSIDNDEIEEDEPLTKTPTTVPANNQGTTPILKGGRLFRKLSMKNKRKISKKQTKRKTRKH